MISRVGFSIAVLLSAALAGLFASLAHLPMAWVLAPMLVTGIASASGSPVFAPVHGRRVGQMVVGATMGLGLSAGMLIGMIWWLPLMIATTVLMILISGFLSIFFARVADIDEDTAFFALVPGGLSEMANSAGRIGAAAEPIALVQAMRVFIVVCMIPPLTLYLGGSPVAPISSTAMGLWQLAMLVPAMAVGAFVVSRIGLSNPWTIGGLLGGAVLAVSGIVGGSVPMPVYALAQFLIGIVIGARFTRQALAKLPRVAFAGLLFILLTILVSVGLAGVYTLFTPFSWINTALMVSPGGLAEISIAARTLHLDVLVVIGFHLIRSIVINGASTRLLGLVECVGVRKIARWINRITS